MASHGRPSSTTMTLLSSPIIPGRRSCVNAGSGWKKSTTHSTGSAQRFIGNGPQCRSKVRNAPQGINGPILIIALQDLLHHMRHRLPTRDSDFPALQPRQRLKRSPESKPECLLCDRNVTARTSQPHAIEIAMLQTSLFILSSFLAFHAAAQQTDSTPSATTGAQYNSGMHQPKGGCGPLPVRLASATYGAGGPP
jgi:hypothetical protein